MKLRILATRVAASALLIAPWSLGCTPQTETPPPATEAPASEMEIEEEVTGILLPEETAEEPAEPSDEPMDEAAETVDADVEESAVVIERSSTVVLGDPELTMGIPGEGPLEIEEIVAWLDDPTNHEELEVILPVGLDKGQSQIKGLDENPMTRAKIELGRQLYFDPRLSSDASISCASCHHPDSGYAAHTQFGVGVDGQRRSQLAS